jgi:hypothetical protein
VVKEVRPIEDTRNQRSRSQRSEVVYELRTIGISENEVVGQNSQFLAKPFIRKGLECSRARIPNFSVAIYKL